MTSSGSFLPEGAGSALRVALVPVLDKRLRAWLPFAGTLVVNLAGCLAMGPVGLADAEHDAARRARWPRVRSRSISLTSFDPTRSDASTDVGSTDTTASSGDSSTGIEPWDPASGCDTRFDLGLAPGTMA